MTCTPVGPSVEFRNPVLDLSNFYTSRDEKLRASDAEAFDNFGLGVALSDAPGQMVALVGAALWDGTGGGTANTGAVYVFDGVSGQAAETLVYDDDGNLTSDGESEYAYDSENRLIEIQPIAPQAGDFRVKFAYDDMGRRVRKLTHEWIVPEPPSEDSPDWSAEPLEDRRFIYDGWNVVMERTCDDVQSRMMHVCNQAAAGMKWRRRESNPRPEALQDGPLRA